MPAEKLHYDTVAKVFHWLIVALLAIQLPLGWLMPDIKRGMVPGTAMSLHLSIGATILLLIVLGFGWRLTHPVAPDKELANWQRVGSALVHWLLYGAVLLTPLTGWFFASARGWPITLFGVVPLPGLVEQGSALGRSLGGLHETLTWILLGLIAVHVGAAFVHLFVYKDRVIYRMLAG
jgi:cytochrome b561